MNTVSTRNAVLHRYEESPKEVRDYFPVLSDIIKQFNWDVSISYVFSRIEFAKLMTIYCGIVKLHQADGQLSWTAVTVDYFSRSRFKELFEKVFGQPIPPGVLKKLENAETIRDKVAHGKPVRDAEIRLAMVNILEFAEDFNIFVYSIARFRPFGKLRGFKGRMKPLGKLTTRWILKGMGFSVS
jgi:hypothetical protein